MPSQYTKEDMQNLELFSYILILVHKRGAANFSYMYARTIIELLKILTLKGKQYNDNI